MDVDSPDEQARTGSGPQHAYPASSMNSRKPIPMLISRTWSWRRPDRGGGSWSTAVTVINFGSDSFLGLDRDPRVIEAIRRGLDRWGTHNGASRAFASVRSNIDAEEKLASWLGAESTLIYPSVTLANLGAIPGLVGKQDVVVLDELAHNSMQEGAKLARAGGTRVAVFSHNDLESLEKTLRKLTPYRMALICIDGVYSMSGVIPPMRGLQ